MLCINVPGTFPPHQVFIKEKAFKNAKYFRILFLFGELLILF